MLRHAGVGDAIKAVAVQYSLDVVVLGWVTAFVIRVAQGSATVAMLTASSILWPLIDPAAGVTLAYNPMYVFLAIGFGAFACSWMNDSGFWVVSKLGGLTERETLRSFTVALTTMSVVGLIVVWIGSRLLPLH
jgi:GntP family gluconate:H+ symporter